MLFNHFYIGDNMMAQHARKSFKKLKVSLQMNWGKTDVIIDNSEARLVDLKYSSFIYLKEFLNLVLLNFLN